MNLVTVGQAGVRNGSFLGFVLRGVGRCTLLNTIYTKTISLDWDL